VKEKVFKDIIIIAYFLSLCIILFCIFLPRIYLGWNIPVIN